MQSLEFLNLPKLGLLFAAVNHYTTELSEDTTELSEDTLDYKDMIQLRTQIIEKYKRELRSSRSTN